MARVAAADGVVTRKGAAACSGCMVLRSERVGSRPVWPHDGSGCGAGPHDGSGCGAGPHGGSGFPRIPPVVVWVGLRLGSGVEQEGLGRRDGFGLVKNIRGRWLLAKLPEAAGQALEEVGAAGQGGGDGAPGEAELVGDILGGP